jgi:predicted nucleotidyltransferase
MHGIELDPARIGGLCRAAGVVRVYLFGSMLTDRFGPTSDVDLLIETDPLNPPGILALGGLQMDLSELLGRRVHITLLGGVPDADRPTLLARARRLDAA